jgi:hypothetical protein
VFPGSVNSEISPLLSQYFFIVDNCYNSTFYNLIHFTEATYSKLFEEIESQLSD